MGLFHRLVQAHQNWLKKGSVSQKILWGLVPVIVFIGLLDFFFSVGFLHRAFANGDSLSNIVIEGLLGQLCVAIIMGFLLLYVVRHALGSIDRISSEITHLNQDDLHPLSTQDVPTELLPVVEQMNALLMRVRHAIEAQRRFVGHASHQFKTPLAALRMESDSILRHHDLSPSTYVHAKRINEISDRLIRLGNQMLVLAKADPNVRTQDTLSPINLNEWVQDSGIKWVPKLLEHGIELQLDAPDQPVMIRGEPMLLEELLNNLLDNALKYAKNCTQITITLQAHPPTLMVQDDGVGIDAKDVSHVFEAFYRAPDKNKISGSGLGLNIVKEIALAHDARCFVKSRPEIKGTLFGIVFPAFSKASTPPENQG